jgi:hypothetical protein
VRWEELVADKPLYGFAKSWAKFGKKAELSPDGQRRLRPDPELVSFIGNTAKMAVISWQSEKETPRPPAADVEQKAHKRRARIAQQMLEILAAPETHGLVANHRAAQLESNDHEWWIGGFEENEAGTAATISEARKLCNELIAIGAEFELDFSRLKAQQTQSAVPGYLGNRILADGAIGIWTKCLKQPKQMSKNLVALLMELRAIAGAKAIQEDAAEIHLRDCLK